MRPQTKRMFVSVDRFHELEDLRRSLAMLPPGSNGLSREEAMALASELQEQIARLDGFGTGWRLCSPRTTEPV